MDRHSWDARYEAAGMVWSAEPNRLLVEEVGDLAPGRALDLGAGEGRNAVWLAREGWTVTAVDFSEIGIQKGRALADEQGFEVEWVVADVLDWEPPSEYDLVVALYIHLPVAERTRLWHRAAVAVAPGGTLLVVHHHLDNLTDGWGGPQSPDVLYTPDEVAAGLDGFEILRTDRVMRRVATDDGERIALDGICRARRPG